MLRFCSTIPSPVLAYKALQPMLLTNAVSAFATVALKPVASRANAMRPYVVLKRIFIDMLPGSDVVSYR